MLTRIGNKKHNNENDDQYRLGLYIRLLFAMGVNWFAEIIDWALNLYVENLPPVVWYITNLCNALYGVVIFFLFVFKKSVWRLLKKRYYLLSDKSSS